MVLRSIQKKSILKLILNLILCLITFSNACHDETGTGVILTTNDLVQRFGQANTTINDEKSCYRTCDGTPKTCYYRFMVEAYDTMSGLCGDCVNGDISDCFNPGCVPANGVGRTIMSVNRRLPGTSIDVCKDDRVIVDVTNHLPGSELAIHWHGILQQETPWMDGVPMVTQCPISSGNTFRYDFYAREAGTHYYHAHSGLHRTNGVVGALNVRQQNDPNAAFYDFDRKEHSIVLSDWNNYLAETRAPGHRNAAPLNPDSILINGRGIFFNRQFNNFSYAPMEVFYVQRGKRYRFRIDNAASQNCAFEFSIESHRLRVIATDSYSVKPITVDRVVSQAGERYDVVMAATSDQSVREKLIRVRGLGSCAGIQLQEFARIVFVNNLSNYAPRNENYEPLAERPNYNSLNSNTAVYLNHPSTDCTNSKDYCVAALQQKNVPGTAGDNLRFANIDVGYAFEFRVSIGTDRSHNYLTFNDLAFIGLVNNISSSHPPIPLLTQDESELEFCNAENLPANCNSATPCHCIHLISLNLCQAYEFFLFDSGVTGGNVSHPIHLHGHGFQVVDMGSKEQYLSGQTAFANSQNLPPFKDTVTIPSGGFVRVRFTACNPGYWFFHCHFEYHMHNGMLAIVKVGKKSDMVPPPANFPTCGNYLKPIYESC